MKTILAQDFLGKDIDYRYVSGTISGRPAVVFVQEVPMRSTSITNLIEVLATKVLAVEYPGMEPTAVRFFEFHPPQLCPLVDWQEVTFRECTSLSESNSLLQKLASLFIGSAAPQAWLLDKPEWHRPVAAAELKELKQLLAAAEN